jgi:Spy/CpxP family protein refolding chaperone
MTWLSLKTPALEFYLIHGVPCMKTNRTSDLLVALFCVALGFASAVQAQPPQPGGDQGQRGGQPGPGGPGGPSGFFGGGGMLGMAMRDDVQQELQLVDEQKDKIRGITDDMRNKIRDQMRGMFDQMRDLSEDERRAKFGEIRTKFEAINADFEKQLDKVLLPHQLERLKQIDLQNKIQQRGASAITSGDVAKALKLTDEQREKLEKRAVEVQEELQTKIRQLQADARKKMLDVLTPEQQAQLDKMMGQQFNLPEPNFGDRFRGRGGRSGRDRGRSNSQPGQAEKSGQSI